MFNYIILSSSNSRYLQVLPQKYRGYRTPTRRQHSLVLYHHTKKNLMRYKTNS